MEHRIRIVCARPARGEVPSAEPDTAPCPCPCWSMSDGPAGQRSRQ